MGLKRIIHDLCVYVCVCVCVYARARAPACLHECVCRLVNGFYCFMVVYASKACMFSFCFWCFTMMMRCFLVVLGVVCLFFFLLFVCLFVCFFWGGLGCIFFRSLVVMQDKIF